MRGDFSGEQSEALVGDLLEEPKASRMIDGNCCRSIIIIGF